MLIKKNKGVSSLIALLSLTLIIVIFFFAYNTWVIGYVDQLSNKIDKDTKFVPYVETVKGKTLAFRNVGDDNLIIEKVTISGFDCLSSGTFPPGDNILDIAACHTLLDTGKHELIIFTPENTHGSYIFYEFIADIDDDPFSIGGDDGCDELQNMGSNLSGNFYLIEDVYCFETALWNGGKGFIPIGDVSNPFTGSLDGQNFTIFGLFIDHEDKETGLFGRLDGANITNLNMDLIYILGNKKSAGAIAGFALNTLISNVHVKGDITGEKKSTGAIVGELQGSVLEFSSYANGTVTGGDKSVGGLVGLLDNSEVHNSFSTGNVDGNKMRSGGLIGDATQAIINNSFSTGTVTTNSGSVGGLIGNALNSDIYNSYWDMDSSGVGSSDGGIGKTTVEMMQNSTFIGWNFTNIWNITEGVSYPQLR